LKTAESQEIGLLRRELGYPTSGHLATREKFTAPRAGTEIVLAWEPPSFSIPTP